MNTGSSSPVAVLQENVFQTLATIAPEKIELLKKQFEEHGITVVFKEEGFHADVAKRQIQVGSFTLERLWAAAHAYVLLNDYYTKQRRARPNQREYSLKSDEGVEQAMQLLSWATDWEKHVSEPEEFPKPPSWPSGLPKPSRSTEMQADNELFFCAVALHLHHELHHIICQDAPSKPGELSIAQEKDADAGAVDWILGGLEQNDPRFKKRVLGIALAFIWPATILFFCKFPPAFRSHPPAYHRLLNALERYATDPLGTAWYSLQVLLSIYMSNLNIEGFDADKVHATPKDYVVYCLGLLERQIEKRRQHGPPPSK